MIEGVNGGKIPNDKILYKYFRNVENGLFARGVKPFQMGPGGGIGEENLEGNEEYEILKNKIGDERASAFYRIRFFKNKEGENLFPRVEDTECRLDSNQKNFIMTGNVDVIATSDGDGVELWDYKSSKPEDLRRTERAGLDARMQMRIYSYIYFKRTDELPERGVIYSLGAIDPKDDSIWDRNEAMILVEDLGDESKYQTALEEFTNTVDNIEKAREKNDWPTPNTDPGEKTCDGCPIRFSCKYVESFDREYENRYP